MNKKKKMLWHEDNKQQVFDACKGVCFKCGKKVPIKYGLIHHLTYRNIDNKSIYLFQGLYLLEKEKIQWCCKICHAEIHKTISIDNSTHILKNCNICNKRIGRIERGILLGLDEPVCRKCFLDIKKRNDFIEEGQLEINF